jgi:hypothetical protein
MGWDAVFGWSAEVGRGSLREFGPEVPLYFSLLGLAMEPPPSDFRPPEGPVSTPVTALPPTVVALTEPPDGTWENLQNQGPRFLSAARWLPGGDLRGGRHSPPRFDVRMVRIFRLNFSRSSFDI